MLQHTTKQTKKTLMLLLVSMTVLSACKNKSKDYSGKSVPTFDITQPDGEKDIFLQDIADIEYIPLETNDTVLIDNSARIVYHSSDKIIVCNKQKGDVFIFDGKGKVVSRFNRKGQSGQEYQSIYQLIYDEVHHEFIVLDYLARKRFQVYDENGIYKRTLPFPEDTRLEAVLEYDDESLVAYDGENLFGSDKINEARKHPFLLISKKDGSFIRDIPIKTDQRISTRFLNKTSDGEMQAFMVRGDFMFKQDKGIIFSDISCDTVFYDDNKSLTPLFIRHPSIQSMPDPKIVMFFEGVAKEYFFVFTFRKEYNFATQEMGEMISLACERATGKTVKYTLYNRDFPTNKSVANLKNYSLISADILTDGLEENKLSGKLKTIAETLSPEDNPVAMIVTMKK